jgi:penicillin amidase
MTTKRLLYVLGFALLALIAPLAYQVDRAAQSLPVMDGDARLPGLAAEASVEFDGLGIPTVEARSREDAYRVLGWLHARDRLFQMELMRRKSAGRLSELFGYKALALDKAQRALQFQRAAEAIVAQLPAEQRAALLAYAEGVNAQIKGAKEFPLEFRLLQHKPEKWCPEDSLLVALGMFQTLGADQMETERMLSTMDRLLPPEVTAFLTPDTDQYTETLIGGDESRRPPRPIPTEAIAKLIAEAGGRTLGLNGVQPEPVSVGSNNWAVNGSKTADGRAMVADDMHLPLGVPNVWYRARLRYAGHDLSGVALPGVPLIVVGSNGHVAWGFTNVDGDFLDLVKLEINPADPAEYKTPDGWRKFETRSETIRIKDGQPVTVEQRNTVWGPVSPEPLLGDTVALRWTALDGKGVNLAILDLDGADSLETAMAVFNRAGIPSQNAVLADDRGRIGWTYAGFFPNRKGFDGSVAVSWTDGKASWDGYIPPEALPRIVDPPGGYIATANNRLVGNGYPFVIGHSFSNGYRAYRIRQVLAAGAKLTEQDLLALQLDTTGGFYEFYRQLALSLLDEATLRNDLLLQDAAAALHDWNGRMDPGSQGIGILVQWRKALARTVFAPLVSRCVQADRSFAYNWRQQETPLRALLTERSPATLPVRSYADWRALLLGTLRQTVVGLKEEYGTSDLSDLTWGRLNRVELQHPFSRGMEAAGLVLDMPEIPGACNSFCVKVLHDVHGASERMVVSPGHPADGILHMPGGQSGHPFSPHYRDQQAAWTEGRPLPFLPGKGEHRLKVVPE